eukprot:NODE_857_length_3660_cov_0.087054.p3 type:complete len:100 gc:universal NODE_857_length_3660_cov_0.087054:2733-2434(-)
MLGFILMGFAEIQSVDSLQKAGSDFTSAISKDPSSAIEAQNRFVEEQTKWVIAQQTGDAQQKDDITANGSKNSTSNSMSKFSFSNSLVLSSLVLMQINQ